MPEKGEKQMRVLRTILGMLLLIIGLPALLIGAGFWAVLQHRDAGGAYSGPLQRMSTTGYALVVEDVDALLRITDFHAVGDIALPVAGEGTFKFTVRTSDIDQSTLTMKAKIS